MSNKQGMRLGVAVAAAVLTFAACNMDSHLAPTSAPESIGLHLSSSANSASGNDAQECAVNQSNKSKAVTVPLSGTVQVTASIKKAERMEWISNCPSVATITPGQVTVSVTRGVATGNGASSVSGNQPGRAKITVKGLDAQNRVTGTVILWVQVPQPPVSTVTVTSPVNVIPVGSDVKLSAVAEAASGWVVTGQPITWSVSPTSVATINPAGVLKARKAGSAIVTATIGRVSGRIAITVGSEFTVMSFAVAPKTDEALQPAATRQFTATATWSDGASRPVGVTYTATGGTITSGGLYTAGVVAGTFRVVAQCDCGRADTATVIVSTPSGTGFAISPKTDEALQPAATRQFTATATWSDGASRPVGVTYTATGGTITSDGLYTAGAVAGTYRVVAQCDCGFSDTADVRVGAAAWNVVRNFNSGQPGTGVKGQPDGMGTTTAVYDNTHSAEGGMAAQTTIAGGTTGFGYWGGIVSFPAKLQRHDELWVQVHVYVPNTFDILTDAGSLKFLRIRSTTAAGTLTGHLDWQIVNDGLQIPGRTQYRMIKEGQNIWYPVAPILSLTRDTWHKFTWHITFDDVPSALGGRARVRAWQNNVLIQDENRVRTMNAVGDYQTALYLFTHWNGGAPKTQSVWIDDIRISNARPEWAQNLNMTLLTP